MNSPESRKRHLVLIDDDQVYNAVMLRAADLAGVRLDVFTSLADLGSVALLGRYDAAIVDYQLEQMTGIEVAEYLAAFFKDLPMVLVSQCENAPTDERAWPASIATFIPKRAGYQYVLEHAAGLCADLRSAEAKQAAERGTASPPRRAPHPAKFAG